MTAAMAVCGTLAVALINAWPYKAWAIVPSCLLFTAFGVLMVVHFVGTSPIPTMADLYGEENDR